MFKNRTYWPNINSTKCHSCRVYYISWILHVMTGTKSLIIQKYRNKCHYHVSLTLDKDKVICRFNLNITSDSLCDNSRHKCLNTNVFISLRTLHHLSPICLLLWTKREAASFNCSSPTDELKRPVENLSLTYQHWFQTGRRGHLPSNNLQRPCRLTP